MSLHFGFATGGSAVGGGSAPGIGPGSMTPGGRSTTNGGGFPAVAGCSQRGGSGGSSSTVGGGNQLSGRRAIGGSTVRLGWRDSVSRGRGPKNPWNVVTRGPGSAPTGGSGLSSGPRGKDAATTAGAGG